MTRIAISPDLQLRSDGSKQSFSARWTELAAESGVEVVRADARNPDVLDKIEGCDGFMWRFAFYPASRLLARRVLFAVEHGLGIPVFPSFRTAWHFEDKVAQHYLLRAADIPTPRTWVLNRREQALAFCQTAAYPLVLKLAAGIQSANVRLVPDAAEAARWIDQLFGPGLTSLATPPPSGKASRALRRVSTAAAALHGRRAAAADWQDELQREHVYFQEFLEGNAFDTRVTVIGDRAFAFRRMNRPGDFRASGSGRIDWNPAEIDLEMVRLAFRVARRLGTQSVAIDGLRRGDECVVGEISYTYKSEAVRECPGHWVLRGEPESGRLDWIEGQMAAEDAIFHDFLALVRSRAGVA